MAAGKVGGYRSNEFRDRESKFGVSRGDYYEHHRYSYKGRERDGRKREEIDDWGYCKSSSRSYDRIDNGRSRYYNDKTADKELGEISSDDELPLRKKQKFSPKEDKEIICESSERRGSDDSELEQEYENDFVPQHKISGSRWADEEEGETYKRGKSNVGSGSSGTTSISKTGSLEDGEYDDIEVDGIDNRKVARYGSDTDLEGEDDFLETPESMGSPCTAFNVFSACRSVHDFERIDKIGSGTYGVVFKARDKRSGEIVALKKVKMEKEREGFPLTALREINILVSLHHPSIVEVKEVVVEEDVKKGKSETYLVMEYMEHDLKGLMETMKQPFSQSEVKCLMLQLLQGVEYLHDNWVLHRDLKTSNLLLNNCGELKICDFGLSRQYGSPLRPYTPLVVSLWYRAPELLLGAKQYSTAIDMWSLGCIMAELLANVPLFRGESEIDQLNKIFRTLGTPDELCWPGFSKLPGVKVNFVKQKHGLLRKKFPPTSFTGSHFLSSTGFDLLERLLAYDPEKRITARDAVNHEWFREAPLPKAKEFMPTFLPKHAKAGRPHRIKRNPDQLDESSRGSCFIKKSWARRRDDPGGGRPSVAAHIYRIILFFWK